MDIMLNDHESLISTIERHGEIPLVIDAEEEEEEEDLARDFTVFELWQHVKIAKPSQKRMVLRVVREIDGAVLRYDFEKSWRENKGPNYGGYMVKNVYADLNVSRGVNGEPIVYPVLICEI